ncbi:hypothetical protein A9995_03860 [Erythrobacter sp. QSSC1-22B]|nr:hypothetical protein A9995_03860 [Erythrobacter sp. QSSC1-22B]
MGLSLTGTLDQGSFFFLHNGSCVGLCSMSLTTKIIFSLFNDGPAPVDLRFDSQITPGHLANSFLDVGSNSIANFAFAVSQDPGLRQGILYTADGTATSMPPLVNTSDGEEFNNFLLNSNATPEWNVLDWSATDLAVQLATLAPGATTNLYYTSTLTIRTNRSDCLDPTLCESLQVAFGDPRNAGGVLSSSRSSLMSLSSDANAILPLSGSDTQSPAVGAIYDPFRVSYQFVDITAPFPFPAEAIPQIQYNTNYRGPTGAVPEPSTWLMLIVGFFALGGQLRRCGKLVRRQLSGPL